LIVDRFGSRFLHLKEFDGVSETTVPQVMARLDAFARDVIKSPLQLPASWCKELKHPKFEEATNRKVENCVLAFKLALALSQVPDPESPERLRRMMKYSVFVSPTLLRNLSVAENPDSPRDNSLLGCHPEPAGTTISFFSLAIERAATKFVTNPVNCAEMEQAANAVGIPFP
jgi:hypothetical protein